MAIASARPSAAPSFTNIFPLELSTFEMLMLADARPDYPMIADLELHFEGRLERDAFERGLAFALERNPLFTCLVVPGRRGAAQWRQSGRQPQVDWATWGVPVEGYGEPMNLEREVGLKVWVRASAERSTMLLHFHHACSDGLGAYAFIEDFLVGYNAATPGAAPVAARPLEPERLRRRGAIPVMARSLALRLVEPFLGVWEGYRFFSAAPLTLTGANPSPRRGGQAQFVTHTCNRAEVEGLRVAATRAKATLNDVLLRDLMVTLRQWPGSEGPPSEERYLRILMPQSLRDAGGGRMPACNSLGFAFITRKAGDCDAPRDLLASIARETAQVRRWRLSGLFVGALAVTQSLGVLAWLLQRRFCFATATLSNLGHPMRRFVSRFPRVPRGLAVGNVVFQGLTGGPPLRPLTRASLGVSFAGDTMTVCLKGDLGFFSQEEIDRLLAAYVSQLQSTAASAYDGAQRASGGGEHGSARVVESAGAEGAVADPAAAS
jgi:hypothetical protein